MTFIVGWQVFGRYVLGSSPSWAVGAAVGKISVEDAVKSIWPFYLALILALMLITFVPQISLTLPAIF